MKYCKNCGKEVETVGTNYCPNCGAILSASENIMIKGLRLYELGTLLLAVILLIFPFTWHCFSREVEDRLGVGSNSIPWTTTRHYSFFDALALNDKDVLVVLFACMLTVCILYCIVKLSYIFQSKNIVKVNKVSHIYRIIFIVLSILCAVLFAISTIIILNINDGLKPQSFFLIYIFIVLCMPIMDLSPLIGKKSSKSNAEESKCENNSSAHN